MASAGFSGQAADALGRARDGLVLHRSEVHAQSELEPKDLGLKAANRRNRGYDAAAGAPFKPLGEGPKFYQQIREENDEKLERVDREKRNAGRGGRSGRQRREANKAQNNAQPNKAFGADGYGEQAGGVAGAAGGAGAAGEGLAGKEGDDEEGAAKRKGRAAADPRGYGLFDKNLPRTCARDKMVDGFCTLREFIKESEIRVQQVKSSVPDVVYGLDYSVNPADHLMPDRAKNPKYAVSDRVGAGSVSPRAGAAGAAAAAGKVIAGGPDGGSAASKGNMLLAQSNGSSLMQKTGRSGAMSAREHTGRLGSPSSKPAPLSAREARRDEAKREKHCPGRPDVPQTYRRRCYVSPVTSEVRPMPVALPSLASFVESSGPGLRVDGEQGAGANAGGPQQPPGGQPPGGQQPRRQRGLLKELRKKLERAEKDFWREMKEQGYELKPNVSLLTSEDEKKTTMEAAKGGADGTGGGNEAKEGAGDEAERGGAGERGDPYSKVISLLRETDPTLSPVSRLRETLRNYQGARTMRRVQLQDTLYSMDADRLPSLVRRANHLKPTTHGPAADSKTACQLMRLEAEREMLAKHAGEAQRRQIFWYKELLQCVYDHKRDLHDHKVAHFIFDYIQRVLESGERFDQGMYFAMLSKIESHEFNHIVAKVVVRMLDGIDGVKLQDLLNWFNETRGEVPGAISKIISSPGQAGSSSVPATTLGDGGGPRSPDSPEKPGATFVTEREA